MGQLAANKLPSSIVISAGARYLGSASMFRGLLVWLVCESSCLAAQVPVPEQDPDCIIQPAWKNLGKVVWRWEAGALLPLSDPEADVAIGWSRPTLTGVRIETGKVAWQTVLPDIGVDVEFLPGERGLAFLYTRGEHRPAQEEFRLLYAVDVSTGKIRWKADVAAWFPDDFVIPYGLHGQSDLRVCPGHVLMCVRGKDAKFYHDRSYLVCLDARTGKTRWTKPFKGEQEHLAALATLVAADSKEAKLHVNSMLPSQPGDLVTRHQNSLQTFLLKDGSPVAIKVLDSRAREKVLARPLHRKGAWEFRGRHASYAVVDPATSRTIWKRDDMRATYGLAFDQDTVYWVENSINPATAPDRLFARDWKTGRKIGSWDLPMYPRENQYQYSHQLGMSTGQCQFWHRVLIVPPNIFGPDGTRGKYYWAINLKAK